MLKLFRNNSPFTVIVLFIFALLAKFRVLLHPALPVVAPGHFLFGYIVRGLSLFLGSGGFSYTMLAVILLYIQALYLKSITTRHKLFPKYTYVPAYVYLLLTSIYPEFSYFNETIIVNWLLMGAMDYMFSFTQTTVPRKLIFNASMLLSIAALFQCTMATFFSLLLVGLVLFRSFNVGEYCVALMGYATPPYFLAGILFLADRLAIVKQWPHLGFSLSSHVASPFFLIVTLVGIFILMASGIQALQHNVAISNIYVRRDWIAVAYYLLTAVVVALLTDAEIKSAWLITIPALSIVISHSLLLERNKRFSGFIFYFSLVYLVFCVLANR